MLPTDFNAKAIKPIQCLKEAWTLIRPNYWLLFAIFLVGALLGGMTLYALIGAMLCGIVRCYLRKVDGGDVKFEDLWSGLSFFWASLPTTILIIVPIVVWVAVLTFTLYLPMLTAAITEGDAGRDRLLATFSGVFVFDIVFAVLMTCLHSLLVFAFPLIVDRGLRGFQPITVSTRAVMKNLGGIGGLVGINFLLTIAGLAACGIGMYLLIPLMMATTLIAYRKVFPALPSTDLNPSPPNAYSELQ